jgi:hypothetical protein
MEDEAVVEGVRADEIEKSFVEAVKVFLLLHEGPGSVGSAFETQLLLIEEETKAFDAEGQVYDHDEYAVCKVHFVGFYYVQSAADEDNKGKSEKK